MKLQSRDEIYAKEAPEFVEPTLGPAPMPYHRAIVAHLQTAEPDLWRWFSSSRKRLEEADAVRLDLLKSTYRLEPQAQPKLYGLADAVRERMGLTCNVTLYQAQTGTALNASISFRWSASRFSG